MSDEKKPGCLDAIAVVVAAMIISGVILYFRITTDNLRSRVGKLEASRSLTKETYMTITLKAGSVVKVDGLPYRLLADVEAETNTTPDAVKIGESESSEESGRQSQ